VDKDKMMIQALDPTDQRQHQIWVAGPGALVVAKIHKIAERLDNPSRSGDKDALDVYRLLRGLSTETIGQRLVALLKHELSAEVTAEAISALRSLFMTPEAAGCRMVARAVDVMEDPTEFAMSCAFLTEDLLVYLDGND
jgi:hypothetical protein